MKMLETMFKERYAGMQTSLAFLYFVKDWSLNIPDTSNDRFKSGMAVLMEMAMAEVGIEEIGDLPNLSAQATFPGLKNPAPENPITVEEVAAITSSIIDEKLGKLEELMASALGNKVEAKPKDPEPAAVKADPEPGAAKAKSSPVKKKLDLFDEK